MMEYGGLWVSRIAGDFVTNFSVGLPLPRLSRSYQGVIDLSLPENSPDRLQASFHRQKKALLPIKVLQSSLGEGAFMLDHVNVGEARQKAQLAVMSVLRPFYVTVTGRMSSGANAPPRGGVYFGDGVLEFALGKLDAAFLRRWIEAVEALETETWL